MKKYLFLDIDGVLVNRRVLKENEWFPDESHVFCEECVTHLNKIIEHTGCSVVISSSWRKNLTVEQLREIFKLRGFKFSENIIDKTISIYADNKYVLGKRWVNIPRGSEIQQWLMSQVVDNGSGSFKILNVDYSYAILDDSQDMLYGQRNNFVNTNYEIGLTEENADQVIKILNQ
ncbi:MAG: hypothetical protein HC836_43785 [Richelia sp. RM2_1_2]|nr:hypothetical protein [Richelia sp. RM2_1_2]